METEGEEQDTGTGAYAGAESIPEEALQEAALEEERLASQSDMAKLYDAVKELTKAVVDMKDYNSKKWEETEHWRRAGKF